MFHSIGQPGAAVQHQANQTSLSTSNGVNPVLTKPVTASASGSGTSFNNNIPRDVANLAQPISNAVSSLTNLNRSVTVPIDQLFETLANAMDGDVSISLTYHWGDGRGDQVVDVMLTLGESDEMQVTRKGADESFLLEPHNVWGIKLPGYTSGTFATGNAIPHSVSIRSDLASARAASHPAPFTTGAPTSARKAGPDDPRGRLRVLAAEVRSTFLRHKARGKADAPLADVAKREHAMILGLLHRSHPPRQWPVGLSARDAMAYCRVLGGEPGLDLLKALAANRVAPNRAGEIAAAFERSGLTLTPHNLPDAVPVPGSPLQVLGSGVTSTVYRGLFNRLDAGGDSKQSFEGALKVLGNEPPPPDAKPAGIDEDKPQFQLRALASWRIDKLGAFNCTTETRNVIHDGRVCTVSALAPGIPVIKSGDFVIPLPVAVAARLRDPVKGRQELLKIATDKRWASVALEGNNLRVVNSRMEAVIDGEGDALVAKTTTVLHDYDKAATRRELTRLQWFDGNTGQTDRHGGNIFIDKDGTVRAIDNDLAFGSKLKDPNHVHGQTFRATTGRMGIMGTLQYQPNSFKGACLPKVIDRELADSILSMKPEDVAQAMAGLSEDEIEAEQSRLKMQQDAIKALPEDQILSSDEEWESDRVAELLGLNNVYEQIFEMESALKLRGGQYDAVHRDLNALYDQAAQTSYVAREACQAHWSRLKKESVIEASVLWGTATEIEVLDALGLEADFSVE